MNLRRFKIIPSIPGYLVSEKGEVYSLKTDKILLWRVNRDWYPRVELYDAARGGRFHQFVHRLVAICFIDNPDPINKIEVNHNDWDKMNPYYKNLSWVTPQENRAHARKKWYSPCKGINEGVHCPF